MSPKSRIKASPVSTPKKAVEENMDPTSQWLSSGASLLHEGRASEAADALEEACKQCQDSKDLRYFLACALFESGRYKEALGQFWILAQDDPQLDNPMSVAGLSAIAGMAKCHAALGQWVEAISVMKPTVGIALDILRNLALILEEGKDHARAAHLFAICLMLAPEDVELAVSSAYNKRKNAQLAEALTDLKWAVRLEPRDADLWYELGLTYAMMKNAREARPIRMKALKLNPNHSWAHYDLACLDALELNFEGAFRHLTKAMECGFQNLDHLLKDDDLENIHKDPRWDKLIRRHKRRIASRQGSTSCTRTESGSPCYSKSVQ